MARASSASSTRRCRRSRAARSTTIPSRRSASRAACARWRRATPTVVWIPRDRRYGEKLATPDITIADLIGEVDPIKVAEGATSDELTIDYGLLPRTNRGIFCIDELPDLAERIQVGLLNIMEERDVQIRGYKVPLPLDLYVVVERQPRGLHRPRPDHHAAQGPLRLADPHALPRGRKTRSRSWKPSALLPRRRLPDRDARVHEAHPRRADATRPEVPRDQSALGCVGARQHLQLREPAVERPQARDPPRRDARSRRGCPTSGPSSPRRAARSSWRPWARRARTRCSASSPSARSSTSSTRPSRAASSTRSWPRSRAAAHRGLGQQASSDYVKRLDEVRAAPGGGAAPRRDGPGLHGRRVEFILEGLHLNKKLNKDMQAGHSRYGVSDADPLFALGRLAADRRPRCR